MAFQNKELSVIAYANGFTLWQYRTDEEMDYVLCKKYFAQVKDLMHKGDILIVNSPCGTWIKTISENSDDGITWESLK